MNMGDLVQSSRMMGNRQSATGLRCFEFILGAVFAKDADEAEQIANQNFMRGDEAMKAYRQLCDDYIIAQHKMATRRCDGR
jgi:hypothetical protein